MSERIHKAEDITLAIHHKDDGTIDGGTLCSPLVRKLNLGPFGVFDTTTIREVNFQFNPEVCVDMTANEIYSLAASINNLPNILTDKLKRNDLGFYIRQVDPDTGEVTRLPLD